MSKSITANGKKYHILEIRTPQMEREAGREYMADMLDDRRSDLIIAKNVGTKKLASICFDLKGEAMVVDWNSN